MAGLWFINYGNEKKVDTSDKALPHAHNLTMAYEISCPAEIFS